MGGLLALFQPRSPGTKPVRSSCYNSLPAAGKLRWAIPLPWREDGGSRCRLERRQLRPDVSARRMVAFAVGGSHRVEHLCGVLHVGCTPEQPLHIWAVHLTFLFS